MFDDREAQSGAAAVAAARGIDTVEALGQAGQMERIDPVALVAHLKHGVPAIRSEAGRMLRLIEELMALSRIEADRYRAPSDKVNLGAIVAVAIGDCGELTRERGAVVAQIA